MEGVMNLLQILYLSASNTFIQVGTFVAMTLLIFGYINYKTQGRLINSFTKYKHLQVFFGALLGLSPGCGGAILVMPLYLKGQVTFGTVLATLVATMGDAAFVLIVSAPKEYIYISIISFITALVFGYSYDFFKKDSYFKVPFSSEKLQANNPMFQPEQTSFEDDIQPNYVPCPGCNTEYKIKIPSLQKSIYYFRHHYGYLIIWILSILAFPLGILNLIQIDYEIAFPIKNLGIIGAIGTGFCVIYNLIIKKIFIDDILPEIKSKQSSLKETLIHNAEETSFVVMWIFLALFTYDLIVAFIGGPEVIAQALQQTGYLTIVIALLVGLLPGCGPQIILATLYSQGLIPFSAMLTNAICNDGDALFPLIAMDKQSALYASLYGLLPAFVIGTIAYFLGF